jgi:2-keto-4-pentenoate hydratase/2-oxohepta-3-ene-1,7-dioic acid hydratase in catechol pathway
MKLVRYEASGGESWGAIDGDVVRPLQGTFEEWAGRILADGADAAPLAKKSVPLSDVKLLAPVAPTTRVLAVGVNYVSHVQEASAEKRQDTTLCFTVPLESFIGPDEEIAYPDITNKLDWEVELVAVMGGPLKEGSPAIASVLGYTIGNDTSARDAGMPTGLPPDFYSMKGLDGTKPIGPWIVTRDELGGDAQPDLMMTTRVNGEVRQHDSTANMTWGVERCLAWINKRTVLRAGDIVMTGTCGGTAIEGEMANPGSDPYLHEGDEMELEIEGIGVLRNKVGFKSPNHEGYPWAAPLPVMQ